MKGNIMMGTQSTGSSRTSFICIACLLAAAFALAETQAETKGHELAEVDESYVGATGELTRCGKRFLLETKKYGELEVKQLHFTYTISEGSPAMLSRNYGDVEVVIDDSKAAPTLILKWENPGLEKDRLELSDASYQEAKACIPPPKGDEAT